VSSEPTVVQHNLSIFGTPYIRAMLVSDIDSRSHALSTHFSLYLCITSSYYDPSRQWIVGLHSSLKVPQPKPQAPPNSQRRVPDIVKSLDTEIHALRIFRQANLAFCRSFTVSLSTFLTLAASFTVSILSPASSGANGHRQEPNNCRRAIATAPPLDAAAACRLPLAACRLPLPHSMVVEFIRHHRGTFSYIGYQSELQAEETHTNFYSHKGCSSGNLPSRKNALCSISTLASEALRILSLGVLRG